MLQGAPDYLGGSSRNSDENFWQQFLKQYSWVMAQVFAAPVVSLRISLCNQIGSFSAIRERVRNTEDCPLERGEFELWGDLVNGQDVIRKRQRVQRWMPRSG